MNEPTVFLRESRPMSISAFFDALPIRGPKPTPSAPQSELTTLTPSLLADLQRFERDGRRTEILEVLAAGVRHARPLSIRLQRPDGVWRLHVFPRQRLVSGTLDLQLLQAQALVSLKVLRVEPVGLRPSLAPGPGQNDGQLLSRPLGPLLWHLALNGARTDLLPEIRGPAVYRASPGFALGELSMARHYRPALHKLRGGSISLHQLARHGGFGLERAQRLLNAMYLQSGLIVSRAHQDANRFSMRWW
jgi:hypothetical protein